MGSDVWRGRLLYCLILLGELVHPLDRIFKNMESDGMQSTETGGTYSLVTCPSGHCERGRLLAAVDSRLLAVFLPVGKWWADSGQRHNVLEEGSKHR
jgi:hypothetical protein